MTLLEALVALVILGLAAVGFMGAFQSSSRLTRDATEWVQAVGWAEASMEQTKLGGGVDPTIGGPLPQGLARQIEVEPWADHPGIERVTVTIALPRGGVFVLQRLVRAP